MLKTGCQYFMERPLHSSGFQTAGDDVGCLVRMVPLGSALHRKQTLVSRHAEQSSRANSLLQLKMTLEAEQH